MVYRCRWCSDTAHTLDKHSSDKEFESYRLTPHPDADDIVQGPLGNVRHMALQASHQEVEAEAADAVQGHRPSNEHQPAPQLKPPNALRS